MAANTSGAGCLTAMPILGVGAARPLIAARPGPGEPSPVRPRPNPAPLRQHRQSGPASPAGLPMRSTIQF